MKFIFEKKFILGFLFLSLLIAFISYVSFENKCFSDGCTFTTREGALVPGLWLFSGLSIVVSLFLSVDDLIFKRWLKHIFWWYILITVITIVNTPIFSSNILLVDRGQIAFGSMILLLPITIFYILIQRKQK